MLRFLVGAACAFLIGQRLPCSAADSLVAKGEAPVKVRISLSGAIQEYNQRRYAAAEAQLVSMLKDEPNNALIRYYLANCYVYTHQFLLAEQEYKDCLRCGPEPLVAQWCRAALSKFNKGTKANCCYDAAANRLFVGRDVGLSNGFALESSRLLNYETSGSPAYPGMLSAGAPRRFAAQRFACENRSTAASFGAYRRSSDPYVRPFPLALVGPASQVSSEFNWLEHGYSPPAGSELVEAGQAPHVCNYEALGHYLSTLPPVKPLLAKEQSYFHKSADGALPLSAHPEARQLKPMEVQNVGKLFARSSVSGIVLPADQADH